MIAGLVDDVLKDFHGKKVDQFGLGRSWEELMNGWHRR